MFVNILSYRSAKKSAHSITVNFKYLLKVVLYSAANSNSDITIFIILINHVYHSFFVYYIILLVSPPIVQEKLLYLELLFIFLYSLIYLSRNNLIKLDCVTPVLLKIISNSSFCCFVMRTCIATVLSFLLNMLRISLCFLLYYSIKSKYSVIILILRRRLALEKKEAVALSKKRIMRQPLWPFIYLSWRNARLPTKFSSSATPF